MKKYFSLFFVLIFIISIFSFKVEKVSAGWTERTIAGSRSWQSITSDSTGTKLVAVVNGGYIYTSTDSGDTWTEQTSAGSRAWQSVTSSFDGNKLAAVTNMNYVYISNDSGITWTEYFVDDTNGIYSIASSSDGTKLVAVVFSGYIYTSNDSGNTWIRRSHDSVNVDDMGNWDEIISSSDGNLLVTKQESGCLYTSNNSGVTWTQRITADCLDYNNFWYSITSSSDGSKIYALENGDSLHISTDFGITWIKQIIEGTEGRMEAITSSSDGTKLFGVSNVQNGGGYIYTSTDSGNTWMEEIYIPRNLQRFIALDSTGSKIVVASNTESYWNEELEISEEINGYIWIYIPDNLAPSSSTPTISGTPNISQTLTGSYIYTDPDSDPEGTSTYRWLRDDIAIDGATSLTYTTVQEDVGHTLKFEVTPVASTGTTPGDTVTSEGLEILNLAPTASNITLSGSSYKGKTLTGNYTYTDLESDPEGTSTYRWLRDDVAIDGATSLTYTTVQDDVGHTLKFEVTPISSSGTTTGTSIQSQSILIKKIPVTGSYSSTTFTTTPVNTITTPTTVVTPPTTVIITPNTNTITRTLKLTPKRTTGEDVKVLQSYLNSHNYDCGIVDGVLGTKTNLAIIAFQKANDLEPDGIVGPLTRGKMK